jgi:hypothetical protein
MAAANDKPSRIDEVFADRRWVAEALTAAAADATDRHRRAGVPLVVFRDGRIEHIPAERLTPDVDTLLKDVDFEAERSARELIAWFEERRSAINSCLLAKEPALLHHGRFKRFYEELYPFALWLGHLYAGRDEVLCSLNSSANADRDYDAVVKDRATTPATVTYIQLTTTTFDRNQSLRMNKLTTGGVGDSIAFTQAERLQRVFEKIDEAVEKKSRFTFGQNHVLIVSFDDFMWFGTDDDRAALTSFVTARLPSWGLDVAVLYVVGISGRTFLSFPASPR